MTNKLSKLLTRDWQYGLSRNVPVWHNYLTINTWAKTASQYKLPFFLQCKTHRGVHSDFFYLENGAHSRQEFLSIVSKKLQNPKFVKFLKNKFVTKGASLVKLAKKTKPTTQSLARLFDAYAAYIPALDITAQASKAVTQDLLKMLATYPDREDLLAYYCTLKNIAPIQKLDRDCERGISKNINREKLAQKLFKAYAWIPVNFTGEPWDLQFFVDKVNNYKFEAKHTTKKPARKLSSQEKYYFKLLYEISALNEYRKGIFSQVNFLLRPIFVSIAKKYNLKDWRDLHYLTAPEIILLTKNIKLPLEATIAKRQICALYNPAPGKVNFLYGAEVTEFENKFLPQANGATEVKGTIANKGVARGIVKVIYEPKDFAKFNKGDILVAKMTSVDFIGIMRIAGAFVTDEGGLASHAAIVSREYNIPCVVGTKNGTVVFRDGDVVEVDAEKGIVKKI